MTPAEEATAASKLKPSYHPRLLLRPMSAYPALAIQPPGAWRPGQASPSYPELGKGTFASAEKSRQMQHEGFEEFCVETQEAVELRAVGQGRGSVPQVSLWA